ncbi:MAG: two pore domain potassium channel family protein [Nocardioidaceae bacterium]|nr:two pore domain potassium channel family protein [Nocardioidaceae bacterium]NUS49920.1 two pore domain potassium channel family protein [Nocardioidaceae bacterium]
MGESARRAPTQTKEGRDVGFEGSPWGRTVSGQPGWSDLTSAQRRRLVGFGLIRALARTTVLVALYYLLPLGRFTDVPVILVTGLLILAAGAAWQVRAVLKNKHPGVRAIESLASTLPLFLLLFSAAYFTMASADPANFSTHPLTRTSALYFTVTVFTTVGFGDITAASDPARLIVIVQMLLDLVALGLVVRVFVGAVQLARQKAGAGPSVPPGPLPDQGNDQR